MAEPSKGAGAGYNDDARQPDDDAKKPLDSRGVFPSRYETDETDEERSGRV